MQTKNTTNDEKSFRITDIIPPLIGLAGVGFMLLTSYLLTKGSWRSITFTSFDEINLRLTMQLIVFPASLIAIGSIFLFNPSNARKFFRPGNLNAPAEPLDLFAIKRGTPWIRVGSWMAVIITAGTAVFMVIGVLRNHGRINAEFFHLLPLAFLFAATNAWSEEMFTRFTVVAGLGGRLPAKTKYWISAAIFGIPHFFGTPGGFIGSLMAGFMGWLLAKSVEETGGMFWAWFIHFVQDVVIFIASLMIMLGALP
jgi:hypothetical protein